MASPKTDDSLAGRVCPYCLTELGREEEVRVCERCGAAHHDDCWTEGGGCSVFGCEQNQVGTDAPRGQPAGDHLSVAGEDRESGTADSAGEQVSDEDFTIERRSPPPEKFRPDRRIWSIVAAALILAAIGVAGFLLLGGGNEDKASPPQRQSPKKNKLTPAEKRARAEREAERNLTLRLEPVWVEDPGGRWSARLPQGAGWTKPDSEGDLNDDSYNPLYRTTVWGPEGFVVVDTTPAEDPTANEANYTVAGELLDPTEISAGEFASGQMISYKNGDEECSGSPCVKAMLSDGDGGGVTIWVKSGSMKEAKTIARTFAGSVEPNY